MSPVAFCACHVYVALYVYVHMGRWRVYVQLDLFDRVTDEDARDAKMNSGITTTSGHDTNVNNNNSDDDDLDSEDTDEFYDYDDDYDNDNHDYDNYDVDKNGGTGGTPGDKESAANGPSGGGVGASSRALAGRGRGRERGRGRRGGKGRGAGGEWGRRRRRKKKAEEPQVVKAMRALNSAVAGDEAISVELELIADKLGVMGGTAGCGGTELWRRVRSVLNFRYVLAATTELAVSALNVRSLV